MFIYNITMQADWRIHSNWLQWLQEEYISYALNSGCFTKYLLVKLQDMEDVEGPTYALQLYADSRADYNRYIALHLPAIEKKSFEKWEGFVVTFSTVMQVVSEG